MSAQTSIIRVSTIARVINIPSKYIVQVFNIVEPDKKHSASSKIPVEIGQRLFVHTLLDRAISAYCADREIKTSNHIRRTMIRNLNKI